MALGRPGLEPCVPLEVRFRVVIDQWSRAEERSRLRLSLRLVLTTTLSSKNVQRDSLSFSPVYLSFIISPWTPFSILTCPHLLSLLLLPSTVLPVSPKLTLFCWI